MLPETDDMDETVSGTIDAASPTDDMDVSDNPGVRLHPPLLTLCVLFFGLWINAERDWSFLGPVELVRYPGIVITLAGVVIILWCAGLFKKAGTDIRPTHASSALVTDGPYAYSRNPIYVGFLVTFLGICLMLDAPFALSMLPVLLVLLWVLVVRKEEAYLNRRFGETYAAYRKRVRRWI